MKQMKVSWKPVEAYLMSSQNAYENQMDKNTGLGIQWAVETDENQSKTVEANDVITLLIL